MLTATGARRGAPRRPPPSPEQEYQTYIQQRIEAFKNALTRAEMMRLGDHVHQTLSSSAQEQLPLLEVLMEDAIDRHIARKLRLPSFRKWRPDYERRRAAQRDPTRWGLDPAGPVGRLLDRVEPGDHVVVVGGAAANAACLFAAHHCQVTFLAAEVRAVTVLESQVAAEALGAQFNAYCLQYRDGWLPRELDLPAHVVVVDASALADQESSQEREAFLARLQAGTAPEGVHVLLPGDGRLAPEALLRCYAGWARDVARGRRRGAVERPGLAFVRPAD